MQIGFSLLLASLLLAFVDAAPIRRPAGMVTLPLKRLQQRSDVHPTVLLQQHINRSHRRYARMTGRKEPSSEELEANLVKRFNRAGAQPKQRRHNNHHGNNVDANDSESNAVGNGGNSNAGGNTQAAGNSTTGGGEGFSEVDLKAQTNGGLTAAGKPTADNSLGLDIEANDVGYIATVQVGTPPQDFRILMDSGSADFWIGAEGCKSVLGGCGKHTFLGPKGSSSFVDSGKQFQVTYGSGAVAGNIISDNVNIAGLALDKHVFGVATQETQDFADDSVSFDGLIGLAQSTLSNQGVPTPVEALASNKLITDAITSYKISRLSDGLNDGEITFGGLDKTKFDAKTLTTFDNVNTQGFWEGDVLFSVNGQDLGLKGRTAILDTGTTLIIAPAADAAAVHAKIDGAKSDGQGGFTIPCTTTAVVSMSFGGTNFDINPTDLLFAPVDPNDLTGDCISGISSGNIGGANEWLVGDVFLKNAYFSTDVTKNQISLAKLI